MNTKCKRINNLSSKVRQNRKYLSNAVTLSFPTKAGRFVLNTSDGIVGSSEVVKIRNTSSTAKRQCSATCLFRQQLFDCSSDAVRRVEVDLG